MSSIEKIFPLNTIFLLGVLIHAKQLIAMFDTVIPLLGPDEEILTEILSQLGRRHKNYGVKAEYFEIMGHAIQSALKETLKEEWTAQVDDAWTEIYNELSSEIVRSILVDD